MEVRDGIMRSRAGRLFDRLHDDRGVAPDDAWRVRLTPQLRLGVPEHVFCSPQRSAEDTPKEEVRWVRGVDVPRAACLAAAASRSRRLRCARDTSLDVSRQSIDVASMNAMASDIVCVGGEREREKVFFVL